MMCGAPLPLPYSAKLFHNEGTRCRSETIHWDSNVTHDALLCQIKLAEYYYVTTQVTKRLHIIIRLTTQVLVLAQLN